MSTCATCVRRSTAPSASARCRRCAAPATGCARTVADERLLAPALRSDEADAAVGGGNGARPDDDRAVALLLAQVGPRQLDTAVAALAGGSARLGDRPQPSAGARAATAARDSALRAVRADPGAERLCAGGH